MAISELVVCVLGAAERMGALTLLCTISGLCAGAGARVTESTTTRDARSEGCSRDKWTMDPSGARRIRRSRSSAVQDATTFPGARSIRRAGSLVFGGVKTDGRAEGVAVRRQNLAGRVAVSWRVPPSWRSGGAHPAARRHAGPSWSYRPAPACLPTPTLAPSARAAPRGPPTAPAASQRSCLIGYLLFERGDLLRKDWTM